MKFWLLKLNLACRQACRWHMDTRRQRQVTEKSINHHGFRSIFSHLSHRNFLHDPQVWLEKWRPVNVTQGRRKAGTSYIHVGYTYLQRHRCNRSKQGFVQRQHLAIKINVSCIYLTHCNLNSLWPIDATWRQRSGSTLDQVMACCLTAPSHYPHQCWPIISKV